MTPDEGRLFNDVSTLVADLWSVSSKMEGLFGDPKMVSVMLFRRLWGHHRAYVTLHNAGLLADSDIILRAAVEVTICIAANAKLQGGLSLLLHQDAAHTVKGQVQEYREDGDTKTVKIGEQVLRDLLAGLPVGVKPSPLNWKKLAELGDAGKLYDWHKRLSGTASHVTGFSILNGIESDMDTDGLSKAHSASTAKLNPKTMLITTILACNHHARLIEQDDMLERSEKLAKRLNQIPL